MKKVFLAVLLYAVAPLFSGVALINDSPFPLIAIIQSQDGTVLAQKVLQPGEQKNQVTDLHQTELDKPGYGYEVSMTPYTVIWKCANGGIYSSCYSVSPGALIKASTCPGAYYCKPKPKKAKKGGCCPGSGADTSMLEDSKVKTEGARPFSDHEYEQKAH